MAGMNVSADPPNPLKPIIKRSLGALGAAAAMSGVINILTLTGSLFMLQVYDRVLPSRSVPTLVALIVIVSFLFLVQTAIETLRARLIARVGRRMDEDLSSPAFRASMLLPIRGLPGVQRLDAVREMDTIRQFVGSSGPPALFDLPWVPLYLALCFLFHVWLGVLTLAGAIVVTALAIWGDIRSRNAVAEVSEAGAQRSTLVEGGRRNAEVLATMNLSSRLEGRFADASRTYLDAQMSSNDQASAINSLVKGLRTLLQSLVLALAAYLAIQHEISAGTIIATSILSSRALAPIDTAVGQWRLLVSARQALERLRRALALAERTEPVTRLPRPNRFIRLQDGVIGLPGGSGPLVAGLGFTAFAGDGVGIIGPSGVGKTSLARVLTGVWPLLSGKLTFDGAPLSQYTAEERGAFVGYLPQDVELFDGTIAENIARFEPGAPSSAVIAASKLAYVHELIVQLPQGYDTRIGLGGVKLSAGQRQRIGLARALYRDPFLLVLDEPYSNLDNEGDLALRQAISAVRMRGGIVIVIAHRRSAVVAVNKILVLMKGRQAVFGPKDEVLGRLSEIGGAEDPRSEPENPPAVPTPIRGEFKVAGNVA